MNTGELLAALRRAGVDERRYGLPGSAAVPSRAEDHVRLKRNADWEVAEYGARWVVVGGEEVVPGWEGILGRFATEEEACEVFHRELTRTTAPAFAAEKAAWAVEAERVRQEGEAEIAADEPELAADRAWWAGEWRRRAEAGEPVMTCAELDHALRKADRRARYRITDLDDLGDGEGTVIDRDDRGRWYAGHWRTEAPYYVVKEMIFFTEGELCRYVYDDATGPWQAPPVLTLEQWRLQRALRPEREAELDRAWDEMRRDNS
ncbi:hypothetical protein ABZ845_21450 [Streptomyces sp. NPDC047022]|uniref:hypothetical protein n=1 Tax=Streptomyces sp. NPDC047022 TaxID=3155737 RepID=UPI0033C5E555